MDARYLFSRTVMLCNDTRTDVVEHEICLLNSVLSQIGHIDNIAEHQSDREVVPLDNAHVLGNLCEYRHKSFIAKN